MTADEARDLALPLIVQHLARNVRLFNLSTGRVVSEPGPRVATLPRFALERTEVADGKVVVTLRDSRWPGFVTSFEIVPGDDVEGQIDAGMAKAVEASRAYEDERMKAAP